MASITTPYRVEDEGKELTSSKLQRPPTECGFSAPPPKMTESILPTPVVFSFMAFSDEWHSNPKWGDVEERRFFQRLARARVKGRYVRLKALALRGTGDPVRLRIAIELIERALREWPDPYCRALDHYDLARMHDQLGEYDLAIEHYRRSLAYEDQGGCGHTLAHVDFLLLILRRAPHLREDARHVIERRTKQMLQGSYVERFMIRAAQAVLRYEQGDKAKAGVNAAWALNAAARQHSGLDRYPTLGLVEGMDDIVERMRRIAEETLGTSDFKPQ